MSAWVVAGGTVLAAVAGYVNVGVLAYSHVPVSHMTGAVSRLSIDAAGGDLSDLLLALAIVGGFLAGAALSGALIGGRKLVPGRRYGLALMVEGAALGVAAYLLAQGDPRGVPAAALACGVQNAMASSYRGLIVRTTHVTGIVTDVGVMLGHWARHGRVAGRKLALLASIGAGFFGGGVLGAVGVARYGAAALGVAAAGCFAGGAAYAAWRHRLGGAEPGRRRRARP